MKKCALDNANGVFFALCARRKVGNFGTWKPPVFAISGGSALSWHQTVQKTSGRGMPLVSSSYL